MKVNNLSLYQSREGMVATRGAFVMKGTTVVRKTGWFCGGNRLVFWISLYGKKTALLTDCTNILLFQRETVSFLKILFHILSIISFH